MNVDNVTRLLLLFIFFEGVAMVATVKTEQIQHFLNYKVTSFMCTILNIYCELKQFSCSFPPQISNTNLTN